MPRYTQLTFKQCVGFILSLLGFATPLSWLVGHHLKLLQPSAAVAVFWTIFVFCYAALLALPWMNLKDQQHFTRAQRKTRMCLLWICMTITPHLFWELPWLLFYDTIMAGKGSLWAYTWWAYMDGGDMRYVTRDIYLVTMEIGASFIGLTALIILLSYRKTGRLSPLQLKILMALMVADFYPTFMYYSTEILTGFHNVGSVSDLLLKFVLANSFWLVMPWVVFLWAAELLSHDDKQLSLLQGHARTSGKS